MNIVRTQIVNLPRRLTLTIVSRLSASLSLSSFSSLLSPPHSYSRPFRGSLSPPHFYSRPVSRFHQYAGYILVDELQQRALFYYFVEAETEAASKPLVLWLHGGPGCSSVGAGAFMEHGPFKPTENGLVKNNYSWNKEANMLYLDSPAGVGFSYSANKSFYELVTDEMTARDNLAFLQRWFTKFPKFINNELFISGESYAGHFAPQLAQLIIQTKTPFNLKGIVIGNPLLEFNTDYNSRGEFLWAHGLISDSTYEMLTKVCNYSQIKRGYLSGTPSTTCVEVAVLGTLELGSYFDSFDISNDVCQPHKTQSTAALQEKFEGAFCAEDETINYLNKKEVLKALHAKLVGITTWRTCSVAFKYDIQNIESPTISLLGALLKSGLRVMVFSGDQDSIIPFIGTRSLVDGLAKDFGLNTTESYRSWYNINKVAGRTKVYGGMLSFATIKGAGHSAASTQPESTLLLLKTFLEGKSLPKHS